MNRPGFIQDIRYDSAMCVNVAVNRRFVDDDRDNMTSPRTSSQLEDKIGAQHAIIRIPGQWEANVTAEFITRSAATSTSETIGDVRRTTSSPKVGEIGVV